MRKWRNLVWTSLVSKKLIKYMSRIFPAVLFQSLNICFTAYCPIKSHKWNFKKLKFLELMHFQYFEYNWCRINNIRIRLKEIDACYWALRISRDIIFQGQWRFIVIVLVECWPHHIIHFRRPTRLCTCFYGYILQFVNVIGTLR